MGYKKIHIIRHGEAEHNVDQDYYSFPDAVLTDHGKEQCMKLNQSTTETIQRTSKLVVSSPLRRTLQTSLIGLPLLISRLGGVKNVIVLPELQENSSSPADTGSSRESLERITEFDGLDFSRCIKSWNSKVGFWSSDPKSLKCRAAWTRKWLAERPEDEIVVVSHGSALKFLTEEHGTQGIWDNCECRTYALIPNLSGKTFKLVRCTSNTSTTNMTTPNNNLTSSKQDQTPIIHEQSGSITTCDSD
ncbi:hypothetical protein MJO28_008009 [Puccinia striiformis f. sp. tritici]|uniref:Phosphoglycerate mutase n=3 Tax=Puccinia striiformis TaxID=27350 RepID=A0A0L0VVK5_9BASI|nr:hypothetical protein Pst134EA_015918 [Puccinia striiformis f. sp. tritici]KAI9605370.1 hypothetical protein KEM48_002311 [Puccinia striiformis f. sp. tritici PST-130]KNF03334.1 hypothetical protein PSTG_03278 [Puccinia striiformis f. sp. tritici PST-78]POV97330.1 hypothetical protein PSHT_14646 [Puccinia striiformis]KAH9463838.1 hypothetical protein Pst134EA_015918 [Puccinia striiformis f. sp. tritici]KAI7949188.1 hypothetical protein MJO28_008009 [Puccinia striiformis f. sp. tritici]